MQELRDLDEEVRENYLEILTRCYLAFESVHQYVNDLKFFISEINDGMYIQQSLESIFQDGEGKQLLVGLNEQLFIMRECSNNKNMIHSYRLKHYFYMVQCCLFLICTFRELYVNEF